MTCKPPASGNSLTVALTPELRYTVPANRSTAAHVLPFLDHFFKSGLTKTTVGGGGVFSYLFE